MKKRIILTISIISSLIAALFIIAFCIYLFLIPFLITKTGLINSICKMVNKNAAFNIRIEKPVLKNKMNLDTDFKSSKILITKDDLNLLEINNLEIGLNLKGLISKKIVVNNLGFDYIFADINKLTDTFMPENTAQNEQNPDFDIDLYDSILNFKHGLFIFSPKPDTNIKITTNNLNVDNTQKIERYVHFDIKTEIEQKNSKPLHFKIADNNKVLIKNKHLYVNDCIFDINNSKIHINADASKKDIKVNLSSKKFNIEDVVEIIKTDLIIPNGSEILSYFNNLKGNFDLNINLLKDGMHGMITLNSADAKIIPLNNMPIKVNKGLIQINPKTVTLKDFSGYYGKSAQNKATLFGTVNDYMKSCDTEVIIKTAANNEFTENYLSPLAGIPLTMKGKAGTQIIIKSIYDKIDIIWASKLAKGDDILVDGASLTPTTYDRAVKADMHIEKNILDIKDINYYIASEIKRGMKIEPVLTLKGRFDISKEIPDMKAFGFEIPKPLPSEFLNVLAGQRLFKGGKFSGKLYIVNENETPVIKGKITSNDIKIPSQRIFIKKADLYTDKDTIHIVSDGRFKRSNFIFKGDIKSAVKYPVVIRNLDFELDNMNLEKLMNSFNQTPQQNTAETASNTAQNTKIATNETEPDENAVTFDFNNLIIEKCVFKLKQGSYKDIKFGNLAANLTLDKNILKLHSNKFDIAEGISTVKVLCDLNKHKYYLRLGVKDVNSDIMSTTLLNLPREISGKASGLIEINTDDSMKLNGQIKFAINNGQIQKIGLVEYLMKFAALFRNPIVMISPSIFSDIVNIPEGNFDKISGELYIKDNFVNLLKIKSASKGLSSYIVGCYNLETADAILRIYTKFSTKNKGAKGFLRNISLNSLANRMPISSRNDANYYSAELKNLPPIDADEKDCQIFLTSVDGDIEHNNFLSSLKKIK